MHLDFSSNSLNYLIIGAKLTIKYELMRIASRAGTNWGGPKAGRQTSVHEKTD